MGEYAEAFAANGIDAAILPDLTNEDLKDLGIARLADRKRLLKAIESISELTGQDKSEVSSIEGHASERRQVTVLFSDLVGFTRLTGTLDAEEIHAVLNRYFQTVDTIVQSYGGTIDKHIGDSVMAVFGAPVAHEDDPMRAVRAALIIHERMAALSNEVGHHLQTHIGIANGEVVASSTGSEAHREYTVTGESVNLAARLQDRAQPGETLISDALRRAIGDRVECAPLGEVEVKGLDAPVAIWRLKGLRSDDAAAARSAFVGRRTELAQLSAIVAACQTNGRGQAIVVRGEAGIGKTRLVDEFTRAATLTGFIAHRALVLDFGAGEGRDAIRSLVASLLGIQLGGEKAAHQIAVEAAIRHHLLQPEQGVFLADLLNLPQTVEDRAKYDAMPNAARNEGKRKLVGDLLRKMSMRNPLAIVIEDIHWADPLTLLYLSKIAATVAECPALLVMTSRIEGYPLNQQWRSTTDGCSLMTLDLGPLRKEDAVTLASTFIDTSSQLALSCVERAAGNPLFLENLLRNLEERGGEDVPASIQSLVLARIDRLTPLDKQALQAASVLGQRFSLDAVRHLTKSTQYTCAGLVQRHLVRPEGEEYLFAHALVQEGVYNSLLKARRSELHRDAAAWFSKKDLRLRAEHLDRAQDPSAAGAYLEAAKAQINTFHFETALRLADRGIELADNHSVKFKMMCLRGEALRNIGNIAESIDAFDTALGFSEDDVGRCQAWIGMASAMRVSDRHKSALNALDLAEGAASRHGLVAELVQIHYLRGNVYFPLGNIAGCLAEHEKALAFAREVGSTEGEALALGGLGDAYYLSGRMRTACEQFRSCIALCREHGYVRIEVANRHMVGWSRTHLMEHAAALEDALEGSKMAAAVSHHRAKMLGLLLAAEVEFEFGRFTDAQSYFEQGLELARSMSAKNIEANALSMMAAVCAAQGRLSDARAFADRAVEIVREVGMTFIGPSALATKAAFTEDPGECKKALAEAESILDSGCVAHNHIWFARTAIDHALRIGDWEQAERYATRLEVFTRVQPLPWSDFLIARGRALAAFGRGRRTEDVVCKIEHLNTIAARQKLKPIAVALERALAS